jgi:hypothetical protein
MHIICNDQGNAGPTIFIELIRISSVDTSYLKAKAILGIGYTSQLFYFLVAQWGCVV